MSPTETVLLIILAGIVVLIVGNIAFQLAAELKNPPIGVFMECDGVRLHYIERGDAAAPSVVLFHGNGTMIRDHPKRSGRPPGLPSPRRFFFFFFLFFFFFFFFCFDRPGIWLQPTSAHAHLDRHNTSYLVCQGS